MVQQEIRRERAVSCSENLAEQLNHVGKSQIGRFGVETRTFVPHECVFGGIELDAVVQVGRAQAPFNNFASFCGNMRVGGTKNHQQLATNFRSLRERAGIFVFSKFSVVNSRAIEADCRANVRLHRGAKREMPANAKTHRSKLAGRSLWM